MGELKQMTQVWIQMRLILKQHEEAKHAISQSVESLNESAVMAFQQTLQHCCCGN